MSEEENQMAQGQDKKGMFSGYLKFERPLSCETETHTHTGYLKFERPLSCEIDR